ncbi:hypothetical protein [Poriferisphaera sp. WC338]|uniref:hypothetical protein n=1 Tax=Poriferisphaera sp. WC338 TaxID=3425129 RepID=UPI003D8150C6
MFIRQQHVRRHRCFGLTMIELMLAISATGLIGAAIASMLSAVTYGTSSTKDMRSLVATNKRITTRLSAMMRSSRMVLDTASDGSWLVLWHADKDESGTPNTNELRMVLYDDSTDRLIVLRPADDSLTTELALDANFFMIISGHSNDDDFTFEPWAKNVTDFHFSLSDANVQNARLFSCSMDTSVGDMTDSTVFSVRLRNAN